MVKSDIDTIEKSVSTQSTLGKFFCLSTFDMQCQFYHTIVAIPTLRNLTLIEGINEEGMNKPLRVSKSIWHKWEDIGLLLGISMGDLRRWKIINMGDPSMCINEVLEYWLESPNETYPATWEGLYKLLEDAELKEIANTLKQVLDSHNTSLK
jgi:hypothetical protein